MTIQKITKEAAASFGATGAVGRGSTDGGLITGFSTETNKKASQGIGFMAIGILCLLGLAFTALLIKNLFGGAVDIFGVPGMTTGGFDIDFNFI